MNVRWKVYTKMPTSNETQTNKIWIGYVDTFAKGVQVYKQQTEEDSAKRKRARYRTHWTLTTLFEHSREQCKSTRTCEVWHFIGNMIKHWNNRSFQRKSMYTRCVVELMIEKICISINTSCSSAFFLHQHHNLSIELKSLLSLSPALSITIFRIFIYSMILLLTFSHEWTIECVSVRKFY